MNMDKNLRDIWSNADKEYIDAMKESGNILHNPLETNQTISFNDWCDAQERNSGTLLKSDEKNGLHSQQAPNRSELKKHVSNHLDEVEISNASLWSIWAPTVTDDLNKKDDSHFTFKFGKQDPSDPKSLMKKKTNDSLKAVSTSGSESELSNNCGSQESEDELNEETFGKFAAVPEEFRPNKSDLSDLSEATLLWDSQLKNNGGIVVSNNNQQPISNLPRSDRPKSEITEITSQNNSKKPIMLPPPFPENKSIRKNGEHQENVANSNKSVIKYKTFDAKFRSNHNAVEKEIFLSEKERKNSSNACHVNISDHTLDYEIINSIPGKKTHAIRKSRTKKYSSNSQKNRRIPSKVNYKETLEIETREIIDREGNARRLTRQKNNIC